jgi:hypothetical protein
VRFFTSLLRNKLTGSDWRGEESEAQAGGDALEVTDSPLPEVLFILPK